LKTNEIMKSSALFLLAMGSMSTEAFVPTHQKASSVMTTSGTSLSASRRNFLEGAAAAAAAAMLLGPAAASADARPMYLTEPTDEFKENEEKAAAFKRANLANKKELAAAVDKLLSEADDADALVKDLKDIQNLIAKFGGLPVGFKKEELFKTIRSKKAKGFWPTPVEVG
jgi:hypothetical protein